MLGAAEQNVHHQRQVAAGHKRLAQRRLERASQRPQRRREDERIGIALRRGLYDGRAQFADEADAGRLSRAAALRVRTYAPRPPVRRLAT